jgi:16S rRNA processing protein RimM
VSAEGDGSTGEEADDASTGVGADDSFTGVGADDASTGVGANSVSAGRVGRPHGLDGSFHVTGARPRLLECGTELTVAGRFLRVVRRAGTDENPIVRLEGVEDRSGAEALRGAELAVDGAALPALGEGEWWASELEGCDVFDGDRHVGKVIRLMELPSCEVLQVALGGSSDGEILIPMVRDAIRGVDAQASRIDVDMSFVEGA